MGMTLPDPFVTRKFWVEIDQITEAQFLEVSGLQLETETIPYKEGGRNDYTHTLPVRTSVNKVTIKRVVVESDMLWDWYQEVVNGTIKRRSVSIILYENTVQAPSKRGPVITWTLNNALPVKWVGPAFKSNESAHAADSIDFVCEGLTRS